MLPYHALAIKLPSVFRLPKGGFMLPDHWGSIKKQLLPVVRVAAKEEGPLAATFCSSVDPSDSLRSRHNRNALKILEDEQIVIAGDDQISAGRECAGEHYIVVSITRDLL